MKIRLATLVRVLGFFLGGIVAVLAALAMLLWISFDAERTAQDLTRHFKEVHQRTLQLGQPPQLSLWPRPSLLLNRVALSEAGRNETFASADSLRLELGLSALFRRRFELHALRVDGLNARLLRSPRNGWNCADLLQPPEDAVLPGWQSRLRQLSLKNARLAVETQDEEKRLLLRELSLGVSLPDAKQPGQLVWQGELSQAGSRSELKFRGSARLQALAGLRSGQLGELRLRLDGDSYGLKGGTARIDAKQLDWQADGREGQLAGLELSLRGAAGAQAVDFSATAPELGWQALALRGQTLDARLALRTVDGQSELRLVLPSLKAEAARGFSVRQASFSWQQHAGPERGSQGQIRLDLLADLDKPALQASLLQGEASLQHPRLRNARARLEGNFRIQAEAHELQLQALLGEDLLNLQARLQQLWPLQGRFELGANSLDLDRLLADANPGKTLPPLNWPTLQGHALSGQLKLGRMQLAGLSIASLHSPLRLEQGQLGAESFLLRLHGGELGGKLTAETTSGRIEAQGEFRDLPLERLALETGVPMPLSGKLGGSYRLSSVLKTGQSPLARLNGAIRWNLAGAGLRGVDLQRSLRELAPAIQAGRMSARSPEPDETSELGTASSRFVLENGRLDAERIEARSRWLKLAGSGQADLPRGEMDFRLQAELLPGAPADLAGLRGKPLPLRLKGPLQRPDLRYEALAATRPANSKP